MKSQTLFQKAYSAKRFNRIISFIYFASIFLSCGDTSNCDDVDIRSYSCFSSTTKNPNQILIKRKDKDFLLLSNSYIDTVKVLKEGNGWVYFFQQKSIEGVSGADNYVFCDNDTVIRYRVWHILSPDMQNYVDVWKIFPDSSVIGTATTFYNPSVNGVLTTKNKIKHNLFDLSVSKVSYDKGNGRYSLFKYIN